MIFYGNITNVHSAGVMQDKAISVMDANGDSHTDSMQKKQTLIYSIPRRNGCRG